MFKNRYNSEETVHAVGFSFLYFFKLLQLAINSSLFEYTLYRVVQTGPCWPLSVRHVLLSVTSQNAGRFSKFFASRLGEVVSIVKD